MKKVLYLTNIEVPYRVRFFYELAPHCDLTVLYETKGVEKRNVEWAKSESAAHRTKYLAFRMDIFGLLREITSGYDKIIVGCFNSPVQMVAILAMRLLRIPYILNLDGETFLEGKSVKSRLKRFFLADAEQYLVAGEKAAASIKRYIKDRPVIAYPFGSLSNKEIREKGTAGLSFSISFHGNFVDPSSGSRQDALSAFNAG